MGTYRNNGEGWYHDIQPLWMRLLRWVITTGLEMPHHTPAGYTYRWDRPLEKIRRSIRANPGRSRVFAIYTALCPLSLFGGRVTFQHFGVSYYRRRVKGWYCLNYDIVKQGPQWSKRWKCYRSHNATPWGADTWYFGAPREVVRAAGLHHEQKSAEREQRERQVKATLN